MPRGTPYQHLMLLIVVEDVHRCSKNFTGCSKIQVRLQQKRYRRRRRCRMSQLSRE